MRDDEATWLGNGRDVRARIRRDLLSVKLIDKEKGLMERPPSDEAVEQVCETLINLEETLRPEFLRWWTTGKHNSDFQVEGVSFAEIRDRLGRASVSVVFTWFDGLKRDLVATRSRLYAMPRRRTSAGIISMVEIPEGFEP